MSLELVIEDKRKRMPIILNGETVVTAIYNPSDPMTYKQIMKIFAILDGKKTKSEDFDLTEEERADIEKKLESAEEFEIANGTFAKLNGAMQATMADIDALTENVNAMFGEGVCETLMKYGENGEYLTKLLEVAFKDVNKSRQAVTGKYKAKKKSGVIE